MNLHHVYANRSNAGDWLSALGIQRALGVAVREHLCDEPFVPATMAQLAASGPQDEVVIGGGGLLMDYFEPFWRQFLELDRRFHLWGIGVVELTAEPSLPDRHVLAEIGRRATTVCVRDQRTVELLGSPEGAVVAACPSILAIDRRPVGERGLTHAANLTTVGRPAYEAMREICLDFSASTGRRYRETNNRHEAGNRAGLAHVLRHYEAADVVVSSRLHGCLIGLRMGRPVVAVSGDRKIDEFMALAGLDDWVVPTAEVHHVVDLLPLLPNQVVDSSWFEASANVHRQLAASLAARASTQIVEQPPEDTIG